jgi:ketosteroid isomerase-like protein
MTTGADALAQKDPENVINYLRAYAANRDELITDIKATPRMVVVEVNGRQVAISENASDATKLAISKLI